MMIDILIVIIKHQKFETRTVRFASPALQGQQGMDDVQLGWPGACSQTSLKLTTHGVCVALESLHYDPAPLSCLPSGQGLRYNDDGDMVFIDTETLVNPLVYSERSKLHA